MDESKEKSWIKHYWRPVMAYQYTLRASVRPLLTYFFFFMFCGIKIFV
jgi:hypothetical protein